MKPVGAGAFVGLERGIAMLLKVGDSGDGVKELDTRLKAGMKPPCQTPAPPTAAR